MRERRMIGSLAAEVLRRQVYIFFKRIGMNDDRRGLTSDIFPFASVESYFKGNGKQ